MVVNPHDDESLLRIINIPNRGIGETTIGHLKTFAVMNRVSMFDALQRTPEMTDVAARSAEVMRRPLQLSDVRLEDYDAVYLPGGHGPMQDLAFDADVGRLSGSGQSTGPVEREPGSRLRQPGPLRRLFEFVV